MKTIVISIFIILIFGHVLGQNLAPSWQFIGPHSTNEPAVTQSDPSYNPFKTGRIDDIAVDPNNPNHIVVSGSFAGIWETFNFIGGNTPSANWQLLPNFDNPLPIGMGENQVNTLEFRTQNELYTASSNTVYKFDYVNSNWTQLGVIPNANQLNINQIVFFPNNPNHIFLLTSTGLVESTNAGTSWFQSPIGNPIVGNLHSMLFIEKAILGTYFWYVAGANNSKTALLMESIDDGSSFSNITQFTNLPSITAFANSSNGICLGTSTYTNGDRDIIISTAVSNNNWGCNGSCNDNDRLIYKITKNIYSGSISVMSNPLINTNGEFGNAPTRHIIGFDSNTNCIITGGVNLHAFNLTNNTITNITSIHDDYHAIYINQTTNQFLLGCDGGVASVSYGNNQYYSHRINYGLDICQINGFSGASESNIYVYGQQDHIISALYDETTGKVIATHSAGENDGGLIDKFDDNRLILSDNSSYNSQYFVSTNGVTNFPNAVSGTMYLPHNSPTYYFQPDISKPVFPSQGFGKHPFFQQPFRQNRIFCTSNGGSIFQFDAISRKFVYKFRLQEEIQHFTCSPTLTSQLCNSCVPCTTSAFLRLHYLGWQGQPVSASFSQLDINKMYIITSNNSDPCCLTASQIVQYIGNNLDNVWVEHNEIIDNAGNSQWLLITPDFQNSTFGNMSESDIYHIKFTGIETSNWDKDRIYVSCSSDSPQSIAYKIIVFNGTT